MKKLKKTIFLFVTLSVLPFFVFCQNNLRQFHVNHNCIVSDMVVDVVLDDTVNFTMIFVEGDTFKMGCTSEQGSDCMGNERPVHDVVLSDFYISSTEVTQGQWRSVIGDWSPAPAPDNTYNTGDNYPMYNVSWNDLVGSSGANYVENGIRYYADGFCYKLSVKANGGDTTGMRHYRLPTEAEWEYAARGGNKSKGYKYSGSNTIDDVAWYTGNNSGVGSDPNYGTKPVGTKKANELGLYDMSGNLGELCADSWNGITDYPSTLQVNPCVLSGSSRVIRGGSWGRDARYCRVSFRYYGGPGNRHNYRGFRLAANP
jgi:formylglycine-generating enzyme required for sulfatase activity